MKRRILAILLVLSLCVTAVALAEDEPTAITLKAETLTVRVGSSESIELRVTPHKARQEGVTYQSSDEGVATVDKKGRVKGVAAGSCQVTVTSVYDTKVTATVPVEVIIPVKKLVAEAGNATVYVGGTLQLGVAYEPTDATQQSVTYESAKESVATVTATGLVTGVKRGTAEILIKSADGYATVKQRIDVLQPVTSVSITAKKTSLTVGSHLELKATVEPYSASNKTVLWSSSDEEIATVDERGRVTSLAPGEVIITAASADDPSVCDSVTLIDEQLAQSVDFTETELVLNVGDTVTAAYVVQPEDTSDPSVTFEVSHGNIASVDAQGAVTGLKAGKTTLYVRTADGTRKQDHILVTVRQPVEGVAMERDEVRVGVGNYTKQKAVMRPADATDLNMAWVSSDESVATVSGTDNVVTIKAHKWGECVVTGTTEDGGFSTSITVHGGSYNHAIKVVAVSIKDGKPHLTLENVSNLTITQILYEMRGYDEQTNPIAMSTRGRDTNLLTGSYDLPLAEGERTEHGKFTFHHHAQYNNLQRLDFTVTGFVTEDGFAYTIPTGRRKTVQFFTDLYLRIQNNPRAN